MNSTSLPQLPKRSIKDSMSAKKYLVKESGKLSFSCFQQGVVHRHSFLAERALLLKKGEAAEKQEERRCALHGRKACWLLFGEPRSVC